MVQQNYDDKRPSSIVTQNKPQDEENHEVH